MLGKIYTIHCDGGVRGAAEPGWDHADGCPWWIAQEPTSKAARAKAKRAGWKHFVGRSRWDSRDVSPQCAAALEEAPDRPAD